MACERASSIPSGLIACRIGTEQFRIEEITPGSVSLLCDTALPDACKIDFSFYRPESGNYISLSASARNDGQTLGKNAAGSVRFIFDDAACAAEIRRTLRSWSEYVNLRLTDGPEGFAEKYLGYPGDTDDYFKSAEEQYRAWFAGYSIEKKLPCGIECALSLDYPSDWDDYLTLPFALFLKRYAEKRQLPCGFFENTTIERLYIGSEHCFHLFPDEKMLAAIICKANVESIRLSFATSIVHQAQLSTAIRRLDTIAALYPRAEIIVNDWGMLNVLKDFHESLTPVFGTLINRFRRDARLPWKAGMRENVSLLSENTLNDVPFMEFLLALGVQRFEYACSPEMQLPEGKKSLHFPFYPTNTSAYCPLKAYIESGSRGKQRETHACPAYCENNAFLYPKALNMIHRMRSIFALERALPDAGYLNMFDRLVFNS